MDTNIIGPVLGALGTILAVAVSFSKLRSSFQREINQKIEDEIKNARSLAEGDLKTVDLKLDGLAKDIRSLEYKVDRDIDHVKTIYNSEIKQLSEKIESLRDDMQKQHQQLVGILTTLITEK